MIGAIPGIVLGSILVVLIVMYTRAAGRLPVAMFPIGQLRRFRDRVRRENIVAAAQAMTMAGEPHEAVSMLGRYGLDLCPSCGQGDPRPTKIWSRPITAHPSYVFVAVCHRCHASACPSGWLVHDDRTTEIAKERTQRQYEAIRERMERRMTAIRERAQRRMLGIQERLDRVRRRMGL